MFKNCLKSSKSAPNPRKISACHGHGLRHFRRPLHSCPCRAAWRVHSTSSHFDDFLMPFSSRFSSFFHRVSLIVIHVYPFLFIFHLFFYHIFPASHHLRELRGLRSDALRQLRLAAAHGQPEGAAELLKNKVRSSSLSYINHIKLYDITLYDIIHYNITVT